MKKLFLLFGVLSTSGFLAYTNWPMSQPERLLYSVEDLGEASHPIAINNNGDILVRDSEGEVIRRAEGAKVAVQIESPESHVLVAMNDSRTVLGKMSPGEKEGRCFVWNEESGVELLPVDVQTHTKMESRLVNVFSLNNDGEIGMTLENVTGYERGILGKDGKVYPTPSRSVPKMTPGGTLLFRRNVLYPDGKTLDLPRQIQKYKTPTEFESFIIYPTSLNDRGDVVGFAFPSDSDYRRTRGQLRSRPETSRGDPPSDLPKNGFPFLLIEGQFLNLNLCIPPDTTWDLRWPADINNKGHIVGFGLEGENPRGFLLEPIEEAGIRG